MYTDLNTTITYCTSIRNDLWFKPGARGKDSAPLESLESWVCLSKGEVPTVQGDCLLGLQADHLQHLQLHFADVIAKLEPRQWRTHMMVITILICWLIS